MDWWEIENIGKYEMLKARKPFMETLRLKLSSTAFTGVGSQKAAKYAGFVEDFVIREVIIDFNILELKIILIKFL
jgi:hypothetical protein